MAKTGKLTKLKSVIKRWPSLRKIGCASSSMASAETDQDKTMAAQEELHAVYVGRSKRRYWLSSDTICHPLFQELIERSGDDNNNNINNEVVIACEVVLFEHLLWMLENGGSQLGSMDELVDFYTC